MVQNMKTNLSFQAYIINTYIKKLDMITPV